MSNIKPQNAKPQNVRVVELSDSISVKTDIQEANLAALRSGFARYPANPRWNGMKFMAWKTGLEWRSALEHGKMIVCPPSSLLVSVEDCNNILQQETLPKEKEKKGLFSSPRLGLKALVFQKLRFSKCFLWI